MKSGWFIKYYKVHYIEAGKDTYKFLIKHILIKIPFIIAMAFAGIFVGNKMFEPVNLTMNILTGLAGLGVLVIGVFFSNLLLYTRIRIFGSNLETIESLEKQQKHDYATNTYTEERI